MSYGSTEKKITTIRTIENSFDHPVPYDSSAGENENPHCVLPPHFFDQALHSLDQSKNHRALFHIETWDGRNVMKLEVLE